MSKKDDVCEIIQYILTTEGIINKKMMGGWTTLCELKDVEKSMLLVDIVEEKDYGACRIVISFLIPIDSQKVDYVWCDTLNRKYIWGKFEITNNTNNEKCLLVSGSTSIYVTFGDIDGCRDKFLNLFYLMGRLADVAKKQLQKA